MSNSKKMGVVQLTTLTIVNMMGSAIILLPTKLAEVGTISILSWCVTALGSLALAYAFAKCGRYSRKAAAWGGVCGILIWQSREFPDQLHLWRIAGHCQCCDCYNDRGIPDILL